LIENFKEKIELMQKALHKTQKVDDYLLTVGGITNEPAVQLPPKFSILEADRFTGVGNPKQHLRKYLNFVKIKGLNEQQVLQAFPLSLAGSASNSYYTLNLGKTKNLGELVDLFMKQFSYNSMIDFTLRDLKKMCQRDNEIFSEFLVRWRAKASKMINRPEKKNQVNIVMKGLFPIYYNRMFASPIMDFEQLWNSGMRIEDTIDNGQLDKREGRIYVTTKKIFGSSSKTPNVQANINVVQLNQYQYQCPLQNQYQKSYSYIYI
jgi:hypothetical protein